MKEAFYGLLGFLLGFIVCCLCVPKTTMYKEWSQMKETPAPAPIPPTILHYHVLDKSACQRPV
jgi:hypothetical protein